MGCSWGKCTFCDYCKDKADTVLTGDILNKKVLSQVKGKEIGITTLDVTCSASYTELSFTTLNLIRQTCVNTGISTIILEGHYIFRENNIYFTEFFGEKGISVTFRCGVETFDEHIREDILNKGLPGVSPSDIAKYYEWINLMYGMEWQSIEQLKSDIETAKPLFKHINLSIYTSVEGGPARDVKAIEEFYGSELYTELINDPAIEIFDEWDDKNMHKVGHDLCRYK